MGQRKHLRAEERKQAKKTQYIARLNNCPTSPRKMRLVADLVRGHDVEMALNILKHTQKEAAGRMYKLVLSAIANWQEKNEGARMEDHNLYVKSVMVDSARQLKRIRPAPQGRAHRIRKRSNHITLMLGSRNEMAVMEEQQNEKE
ncbi:MAG: 50S ribosomal protein L22 [Bacteroidales bacterium]